jgi:Arginine/lysine/ornithine decarboxylases
MNFLKIAIGDDVKMSGSSNWETVPFTAKSDLAELAAIVLNEHDATAIKIAENLQETSGLGIPIIKTNSTADVTSEAIDSANKYQEKMVPGFLTDLVNFAEDRPISFTTPGHHNGQYYEKHPAE